MTEVRVSEVLLRNLDKEIVLLAYDYDKDEVRYIGDKIKLWSFIVTMYILNRNINTEKMNEKLENIIIQPKILVIFSKSLKKIFYLWFKDYDLHCRLIIKLYPEIYNPERLLKLYRGQLFEAGEKSQ